MGSQSALASKLYIELEDVQLEIQYLSENSLKAEGMIKAFSCCTRIVGSSELIIKLLEYQGWALLANHTAESGVKQGIIQKKQTSLLCNDLKVPFSLFHTIGLEREPFIHALREQCDMLAKRHF